MVTVFPPRCKPGLQGRLLPQLQEPSAPRLQLPEPARLSRNSLQAEVGVGGEEGRAEGQAGGCFPDLTTGKWRWRARCILQALLLSWVLMIQLGCLRW